MGRTTARTPASGFLLTSPEYESPGAQVSANADGAKKRQAVASAPMSAPFQRATGKETSGSIAASGIDPQTDDRPALLRR
jgi:hypothetical protein